MIVCFWIIPKNAHKQLKKCPPFKFESVKTIFAQQSMKSSLMIVSFNKMVGCEHIKVSVSLVVPNLSNTDVFYC